MLKLIVAIGRQLPPRRRREAVVSIALALLSALLNLAGLGAMLGAVALFLNRRGEVVKFWQHWGVDSAGVALALNLAVVVALLLAKDWLIFVALRSQSKFIFRTQSEWSAKVHSGLLRGDFRRVKSVAIADHVVQLARVMRVCDKVLLPVMAIAADALLTVVLISGAACFMPQVTLAGVVFMVLCGTAINCFFFRKNRELGRQAAESDLAAATAAGENVGALLEIKAAGRELGFAGRYGQLQNRASDISGKLYVLGQLPRMLLEAAASLFLGGLFAVLIWQGVDAERIILIFSALVALLSRLLPALGRIHLQLATIRQHGTLWENLNSLLTEIPAEDMGNAEVKLSFDHSLDIRELSFGYGADRPIFTGFSLTLTPGEFVGISGRTGSGKSTLLALILGLLRPEKGEITCDGQSIFANLSGYRQLLALVPQRPEVLAESIRTNVAFEFPAGEIDDERVWAALKTAKLAEFVAALPGQLDYRLASAGSEWSGGQLQRLAIARAIYSRRRILLMDEPTSALDAATEAEIMDMLRELHGEVAAVVVSHRQAVLDLCDKVIEL